MDYIWKWYQYPFWGENKLLFPKVLNQFIDIGYDNRNVFIALSTLSLVIYYYLFRLVASLLLKIIYILNNNKNYRINIKRIYKIVSNEIFFSLILQVMIEGFIEILICSYFNYQQPNYNTIGEVLGIFQAYFSLSLIVVAIPIINISLLI